MLQSLIWDLVYLLSSRYDNLRSNLDNSIFLGYVVVSKLVLRYGEQHLNSYPGKPFLSIKLQK
jgi:hypothetical protein